MHRRSGGNRHSLGVLSRRTVCIVFVALALTATGCNNKPAAPAAIKGNWVDAWQAVPMGAMPNGCGGRGAEAAFPGNRASSQSARFAVRATAAGSAVRVRLSNRFSSRLLAISHVTIAEQTTGAGVAAGTTKDVLFDGRKTLTLGGGEEAVSDAVRFEVDPEHPVSVSVAIASSGPLTWHAVGSDASYATAVGSGDHTGDTSGGAYRAQLHSYIALAGLQVDASVPTTAIVALGDSITDNPQQDLGRHWVDILGSRLRAAGIHRTVVNAGIACNALVSADNSTGPAAPSRFVEDVVRRQGVSHVIIFEGTNDIYGGQTAAKAIAVLTALADRAHVAGLKVIGATILPRRDGPVPVKDDQRAEVNQWIRTTSSFDGFIDFDAAVRATANPLQMNPGYASDDIHPNTRGQIAMGNAIDLSLFER